MSESLLAEVDEEVDDTYVEVEHLTATGISNEKLGMWLFLASDCLLFGALISTYLVYKNRPGVPGLAGPKNAAAAVYHPISEHFSTAFTSASSFILLMSSLTMVLAVAAIQRGEIDLTKLWLGVTAVLGSLFLGGQVYEFTTFVREGYGYTTNVATSAFYTLTGFHGVHVTGGVIILLTTLFLANKGRITQQRAEVVENVGLYWHFVDVVWIVIFTIVYLIK